MDCMVIHPGSASQRQPWRAALKPSPQAHRLPSARRVAECREPVAMATACSKSVPQRSALSPRPWVDSGPKRLPLTRRAGEGGDAAQGGEGGAAVHGAEVVE